jgi:hypothetical protein
MSFDAATSFYQAPELWHKGEYTNKIDIFSFALVLYEILIVEYRYSKALANDVPAELPD